MCFLMQWCICIHGPVLNFFFAVRLYLVSFFLALWVDYFGEGVGKLPYSGVTHKSHSFVSKTAFRITV